MTCTPCQKRAGSMALHTGDGDGDGVEMKSRRSGFTLIELLVVLAIVALLVSLSVPRYFQTVDTGREKVLIENLRTVRDVIDKYYADTGLWPQSLAELVEKRYLRALPFDPVTQSDQSWIVIPPEGSVRGGVYDIRSGAPGRDRSGRAFAEF